MNKKEFAGRICEALRQNDIKKSIPQKKSSLLITDEEGNQATFYVRQKDKRVLYNYEDVVNVVDAFMAVLENALKNGETVSIHGYGTFGIKYRAARRVKIPGTEEWVDVAQRCVPKFDFGNILRNAALVYDAKLQDKDLVYNKLNEDMLKEDELLDE